MSSPSFIGAQGYGATTNGWRNLNARILFVTNLNAGGPGSFQDAWSVQTGPRYIIFQVGGYIPSGVPWYLGNGQHGGGNVYVAGQTAPGEGVGFKGVDQTGNDRSGLFIRNGQTCLRYIRSRVNDYSGDTTWALGFWNDDTTDSMQHIIVDHCTFSYGSDDNIASTWAWDLTMQYCLAHEGLPGHCLLVDVMGPGQQYTFHHNVLMHFCQRHPLFVGGNGEFHNNLIYNWGGQNAGTGGHFDCYYGYTATYDTINNYYKWGPTSVWGNLAGNDDPANAFEIEFGSITGGGTLFLSGNKALLPVTPHVATPTTFVPVRFNSHLSATMNLVQSRQLNIPYPVTIDDISTQALADAWAADLLTKCGCSRPYRDAVDALVCSSYANFTGNSSARIEADTLYALSHGGNAYGTLSSGTPLHLEPSGMTQEFMTRKGLSNTVAAALSTSISQARGFGEDYQNIEWNLMEQAGDIVGGVAPPPPPPPPPDDIAPTATNRSAAEVYIENTVLDLIDIVVSDVDSPNITATLTLSNVAAGSLTTATSGAVSSTYSAGTGVWTAGGAIANVNALLAGVSFTPALNFSNSFTITTRISDGVATAITGVKVMTCPTGPPPPPASLGPLIDDLGRIFTLTGASPPYYINMDGSLLDQSAWAASIELDGGQVKINEYNKSFWWIWGPAGGWILTTAPSGINPPPQPVDTTPPAVPSGLAVS